MAGTNQFLAFATGTGANVLTPSAYAALTALVAQGFQSGVAPSQQVNTPIRQSTFVISALAQLIADYGLNANDDGDLTTFKNNFSQAIALPRGAMFLWPSATPPAGCLILNGAAISRTTYSFLYSLFNTTFGSGNGSTTFNLPDYRDRVPVGVSPTIALASAGGSKDAAIISHTHTASSGTESVGHTHSFSATTSTASLTGTFPTATTAGGYSGVFSQNYTYSGNGSDPQPNANVTMDASHSHTVAGTTGGVSASHTHAITVNAAGSSATNANMQPYLANNFVIKY